MGSGEAMGEGRARAAAEAAIANPSSMPRKVLWFVVVQGKDALRPNNRKGAQSEPCVEDNRRGVRAKLVSLEYDVNLWLHQSVNALRVQLHNVGERNRVSYLLAALIQHRRCHANVIAMSNAEFAS